MTRKILNLSNPGTATLIGSEDFDYINKYLTGEDQSLADPVSINTLTTFGSEKFCIAGTAGFKYIFRGKAIAADRYVDLPLMGEDGEIALANTNSANDWGLNTQTFRHQNIIIRNPANTFSYIINTSAITANRNATLPLLTTDDTFAFLNATQNLDNKTLVNPTLSGLLKTLNLSIKEDDADTVAIRNIADNAYKNLKLNQLKLLTLISQDGTKIIANDTLRLEEYTEVQRVTAPIGNAPLGYVYLYVDNADGVLKTKDASGNILALGEGGGGGGGSSGTNFYDELTVNGFKYGVWNGMSSPDQDDVTGDYGLFSWIENIGGSPVQYLDSTNGYTGQSWSMSSSSANVGWKTENPITMRKLYPDLEVAFQLFENGDNIGSRVWIGFTNNNSLGSYNNSTMLNDDVGFLLHKRSNEDFFKITRNDGDATQDESASILVNDGGIHTIRLVADEANTRWGYSLDGAALTYFNTEIPTSTDQLVVVVNASQDDSTVRSFRAFWARMKMAERA